MNSVSEKLDALLQYTFDLSDDGFLTSRSFQSMNRSGKYPKSGEQARTCAHPPSAISKERPIDLAALKSRVRERYPAPKSQAPAKPRKVTKKPGKEPPANTGAGGDQPSEEPPPANEDLAPAASESAPSAAEGTAAADNGEENTTGAPAQGEVPVESGEEAPKEPADAEGEASAEAKTEEATPESEVKGEDAPAEEAKPKEPAPAEEPAEEGEAAPPAEDAPKEEPPAEQAAEKSEAEAPAEDAQAPEQAAEPVDPETKAKAEAELAAEQERVFREMLEEVTQRNMAGLKAVYAAYVPYDGETDDSSFSIDPSRGCARLRAPPPKDGAEKGMNVYGVRCLFRDARLLDNRFGFEDVDPLFERTIIGTPAKEGNVNGLSFEGMVMMFVEVAMACFPKLANRDLPQAIDRVQKGHVITYCRKQPEEQADGAAALPEVPAAPLQAMLVFQKYMGAARVAFAHYATLETVGTALSGWDTVYRTNRTLSELEFLTFLLNFEITPQLLAKRDAKAVFQTVCSELGVTDVTLPEFMECLCRCALLASDNVEKIFSNPSRTVTELAACRRYIAKLPAEMREHYEILSQLSKSSRTGDVVVMTNTTPLEPKEHDARYNAEKQQEWLYTAQCENQRSQRRHPQYENK
ncbi:hypothetical protein CYMTET_23698 [Cymbomonas tetramitiformis]|uniref:Uncharacterized protein n=1 Tax=Cymbomonas tetramitiformis TaxID=36881 RepID=A0AAE0L0P3_9CHLO|nr:hypothetical protein CYMTET_23698 [Cymbomonas tetramitiformis]